MDFQPVLHFIHLDPVLEPLLSEHPHLPILGEVCWETLTRVILQTTQLKKTLSPFRVYLSITGFCLCGTELSVLLQLVNWKCPLSLLPAKLGLKRGCLVSGS